MPKHHFVPQFYLRAFLDPNSTYPSDPYLWYYDKHLDEVKCRSPKNVAARVGFYRSPALERKGQSLETLYTTIESRAAPVLARLRSGRFFMSRSERRSLLIFVALQIIRTPLMRSVLLQELRRPAEDSFRAYIEDEARMQANLDVYNESLSPRERRLTVEEIRKSFMTGELTITPNTDFVLAATLTNALSLVLRMPDKL